MQMIAQLEQEALQGIATAQSTAEIRDLELKYLGKNGSLTGLMRHLGQLSPEERPLFGKAVNEAKARIEAELTRVALNLKAGEQAIQFEQERLDISMPARQVSSGLEHILRRTEYRIREIFCGLGFQFFDGPELEEFRFNFDALNYPPDHPAMDEQDTFYVDERRLLRTQCTAIQGRVFENAKPPLRYFTVGKTYRNEAVDRTHSHTFHQVDVFMIDEGVTMADLKGTLGLFARAMFGDDVKIRFRPDFFPFVEPGVDYAISTPKLFNGRWLELGGAGLIHPNILEAYGIDSEKYSGFAFGLGVERIPMMQYGIDDLRYFMENDLRFLEQFQA